MPNATTTTVRATSIPCKSWIAKGMSKIPTGHVQGWKSHGGNGAQAQQGWPPVKLSKPVVDHVEWYFNLQEMKVNGNPSIVRCFMAQKLHLEKNSIGQITWAMVSECFYGDETCPSLSVTNSPSFFIFTINLPFLWRAAELCLLKRDQCFGLTVTLQRTEICTQHALLEETFHLPQVFIANYSWVQLNFERNMMRLQPSQCGFQHARKGKAGGKSDMTDPSSELPAEVFFPQKK